VTLLFLWVSTKLFCFVLFKTLKQDQGWTGADLSPPFSTMYALDDLDAASSSLKWAICRLVEHGNDLGTYLSRPHNHTTQCLTAVAVQYAYGLQNLLRAPQRSGCIKETMNGCKLLTATVKFDRLNIEMQQTLSHQVKIQIKSNIYQIYLHLWPILTYIAAHYAWPIADQRFSEEKPNRGDCKGGVFGRGSKPLSL